MQPASPAFILNRQLDIGQAARRFAQQRIVQIPDVFDAGTAQRLHACLETEVPWGLAYELDGSPQYLDSAHLARIQPGAMADIERQIRSEAGQGFQYRYLNYPILDAYLQQWPNEVPLLHAFLEYINGPQWLSLIRAVSGMPELVKCDAQASLYAPDCFLHRHSDAKSSEGWRIAYVLGMTRDWRPDFGGALQFLDDAGNTTLGLMPQFNTLNLFAVPRWHMVTHVPPYAPVGRYAITGWLRDR
ncbi:2OG-Fe(II) oxygenase [Luteimonas deserti]|uniref:2OG-Fe(II) oxygenase n=1 Tax=Luteimonas deserti TaxID=2752306 RepID=A0A7Z0QR08_9GAMM|nr:2OG-Fe(II) oxygenase family protein [Luteimonas deserti]NYZ63219.1 2OG-Fe(II) oxygenase [Luteimonas deserti]